MPIQGATLAEALTRFQEHLNFLLARTVTATRLMMFEVRHPAGSRMQLAFRQAGTPREAPLSTRFGRMHLYLGQTCDSIVVEGWHRLRTIAYRYTLRAEDAAEAVFRWEYEKQPPVAQAQYCRHHVQGDIPLTIGRANLSLNDLHVPTGFVTIEEILRFCIVDLGVPPLSGDWHRLLEDSYERFKTDFAPRGPT